MEETKNDKKYLNGKIYTLRSHQTDKYYIGSTIQSLHKRLHCHRSGFKTKPESYKSSYEIIKFDDNYIELLEEYPCENKMQLEKREGELIRQFKNDLVNISIAGRTDKEYYIDNKDILTENNKIYQINNKDAIAEQKKQYYIKNKDAIAENNKIYQINNKDAIAERRKQYYIKNKDDIRLKGKERYTCGCGSTVASHHKSRHNKSLKHIAYLQSIVSNDTT